jgi:serine/threonine-protein kinase RsbW
VNQVHRLTLTSNIAEVARLMTWIDGIVETLELPTRTTQALRLCLEEAVTNVTSHAFEPGTTHEIQVAVWRDDTMLHAEVSDDGRPFDPMSHQLPTTPLDLESVQIGGMGIKLMRSFAQRMAYERVGAMNRLSFSFSVA